MRFAGSPHPTFFLPISCGDGVDICWVRKLHQSNHILMQCLFCLFTNMVWIVVAGRGHRCGSRLTASYIFSPHLRRHGVGICYELILYAKQRSGICCISVNMLSGDSSNTRSTVNGNFASASSPAFV